MSKKSISPREKRRRRLVSLITKLKRIEHKTENDVLLLQDLQHKLDNL